MTRLRRAKCYEYWQQGRILHWRPRPPCVAYSGDARAPAEIDFCVFLIQQKASGTTILDIKKFNSI